MMFYIDQLKSDSGVQYLSVLSTETDYELMTWACDPKKPDDLDWQEALDRAMQLVSYLNGGARPSWLTAELYS